MLTRHSHFFPDPYEDVLSGGITIEFYGYRKPNTVDSDNLIDCVVQAGVIAIQRIQGGQGDSAMGTSPYSWSSGNINLWLGPEELTWLEWTRVLSYIMSFVKYNELRGTQFGLSKDGVGPIGSGHLISEASEKSIAANLSAISNTNLASLNLVNPGLNITPTYTSIPGNRSRQGKSPTCI